MAVKELGLVYGSQVANEATDYIAENVVPQSFGGVKLVDLGLGAAGAAAAMGKLPKVGATASQAIEIIGLGRLAKATMNIVSGFTGGGQRAAMGGGLALPSQPVRVRAQPREEAGLAPAGY